MHRKKLREAGKEKGAGSGPEAGVLNWSDFAVGYSYHVEHRTSARDEKKTKQKQNKTTQSQVPSALLGFFSVLWQGMITPLSKVLTPQNCVVLCGNLKHSRAAGFWWLRGKWCVPGPRRTRSCPWCWSGVHLLEEQPGSPK